MILRLFAAAFLRCGGISEIDLSAVFFSLVEEIEVKSEFTLLRVSVEKKLQLSAFSEIALS